MPNMRKCNNFIVIISLLLFYLFLFGEAPAGGALVNLLGCPYQKSAQLVLNLS